MSTKLDVGLSIIGVAQALNKSREFHERLPGEWSLGGGVYEVLAPPLARQAFVEIIP